MLAIKPIARRLGRLAAIAAGLLPALSIGLLATMSISHRDDAGRSPASASDDPPAVVSEAVPTAVGAASETTAATPADGPPPPGPGDAPPAAGEPARDVGDAGAERLKLDRPGAARSHFAARALIGDMARPDRRAGAAESGVAWLERLVGTEGDPGDMAPTGADAAADGPAVTGATDAAPAGSRLGLDANTNTITLAPTADVFVISGADAGKNFGASKSLKAMKAAKAGGEATQSYLRFDVGAVGTITRATLRVYCVNDSRDSFDVVPSPLDWDEKTMTWNTRPAVGGDVVASAKATRQNTWVEVDVTAAVRASAPVAFALVPRSTDAFAASSRDSATNPPVLVIESSPGAPAAPPAPPTPAAGGPITAEADTYVRSSRPTANFGAERQVLVDRDDENEAHGLVRFRIGDVGIIARATVRLFVEERSEAGAEIHLVSANDWDEATVTWNTRPAVDGPVVSLVGETRAGRWVEVDVSTLATPNSRLSLAVVPRSGDDFAFSSRDGQNPPQLVLTTVAVDAVNLDCTLVVPDKPLTPEGLATPYELVATDPAQGACHQYVVDQRAFVEAAILDPATGQVSLYHPLVIDKGTVPVIPPVVPQLPPKAVVAVWLGFNGDFLRQRGATDNALSRGRCMGGIDGDAMGQFSHCNAEAFFAAANRAIAAGQLVPPPLGTGADGLPCPTVRDFFTVDQDQSDNVLTTYLLTADGRLAQNTTANRARLGASAKVIANPSDNRVTAVLLDGALGCTPWNAPSVDNPGEMVPSLALNELSAAKWQVEPQATVPLLDPFARLEDGKPSLAKLNVHRAGVSHPRITSMDKAISHQVAYCRNLREVQPARLFRNRERLAARPSPFPDIGDSAFTFLVTRFNVSWELLQCEQVIGLASPITLQQNAAGITVGATLGR